MTTYWTLSGVFGAHEEARSLKETHLGRRALSRTLLDKMHDVRLEVLCRRRRRLAEREGKGEAPHGPLAARAEAPPEWDHQEGEEAKPGASRANSELLSLFLDPPCLSIGF